MAIKDWFDTALETGAEVYKSVEGRKAAEAYADAGIFGTVEQEQQTGAVPYPVNTQVTPDRTPEQATEQGAGGIPSEIAGVKTVYIGIGLVVLVGLAVALR